MVPMPPRCTSMAPTARYHCSILFWMNAAALLVLLIVGSDAAHREAERILHGGIEVEIIVCVRQRCLLQIRAVHAVRVLLHNAFHAEPHAGALPNVLMPAALIGR